MRLFVAVEIPADIQESLGAVRRSSEDSAWRWVAAGNVHLTLKFLGEVGEELVPKLADALTEVCTTVPFELDLVGLATLPPTRPRRDGDRRPERPPRVLYSEVNAGAAELRGLARRVEDTLVPFGFERERRAFTPHATLARVRKGQRPRDFRELLDRFDGHDFGGWRCEGIVLFQSELGPGGASYTSLGDFPFGV